MCHDVDMRVDHVSYAAEHDGLHATAERLGKLIGVTPVDGGVHPRFGTRNVILPLTQARYVEVVETLDHPASDKAPFGQAVRSRSENGGGWLGWAVCVDDIEEVGERLGREPAEGYRHTPDGRELRWRQLGYSGPNDEGITRNPFGYHDGIIVARTPEEQDEDVWIADGPF